MNDSIQHINQLITQPQHSNEDLEILLSQYATGIASGSPNFIDKHFSKIDELFQYHENELVLAKGLRKLLFAITCYYQTNFDRTITPAQEAITLFTALKQNNLLGMTHWALGANYRSLGEIDEAVKHLYKGVESISDNGNFTLYKCYCYYQLAEINVSINDNEAARNHYHIAVRMAEISKDSSVIFRVYNGLANLLMGEKNFIESIEYFNKTLLIDGVTASQQSRTYCDLGAYYFKTGDLKQSKNYFEQSISIRKELHLKDAYSTALIGLGKTLLALNLISESIEKLNEALAICVEFNSNQKLTNCYHLLAQAYLKNKDWKQSAKSYELYDDIQQRLNSIQLQKIYKLKNNEIHRQKELVEEAHKEITDSMNYAERIQRSFLATKELLDENLNDYFVYFNPKEVVSGDFYWAGKLANGNFAMVNADSTGHGVPGAIMSILNISSIEKAVEKGLTKPPEIFNDTRKTIINRLKKDGSVEGGKDGMDASIISFDFENNKFSYTAAQNPIWILRKRNSSPEHYPELDSGSPDKKKEGSNYEILDQTQNNDSRYELIEIKPEKMPLGKHDNDSINFVGGVFETQKGDVIYTLTDGYQDQFGGPKGKKFKVKPFKNLLHSIAHLPMQEQKEKLTETFTSWKGNEEQVDDVCVIGVRI